MSIHKNFQEFMCSYKVKNYVKKSNDLFEQQFLIHQSLVLFEYSIVESSY
jgi:hypothetical protein